MVALGIGGVILRPFGWPEAVWAVAAAVLLVACGLLAPAAALRGVAQGGDVYLFLTGMLLLSELARREGVFDWLAAKVARRAAGSAARLFGLVYGIGIAVTVFLSNDATAVVLTPAVAAVARAAGAADPLPYLLACAFVANAASFVLPISNPANLVIYGAQLPPLSAWLARFALPSALAIAATFFLLKWLQAGALRLPVGQSVDQAPRMSAGGRLAAGGIVGAAIVLLLASGFGVRLGLPTCLAGLATAALVQARRRQAPWALLGGIAWGVLPLVAGLFVLVAGLDAAGLTAWLAAALRRAAQAAPGQTMWATGLILGFGGNLTNNLPAALVAGHAAQAAGVSPQINAAALAGVDLGPNFSVTGSLATILWLSALRREGVCITAGAFLKIGAIVMPPALLLALAGIFAGG